MIPQQTLLRTHPHLSLLLGQQFLLARSQLCLALRQQNQYGTECTLAAGWSYQNPKHIPNTPWDWNAAL